MNVKSTKVCDEAIKVVLEGIEVLEACKTDDVIYGIIEEGMAVCIDQKGLPYLGSAVHAAPAREVSKALRGNILRNGLGHEAVPMLRQVMIAVAVDMARNSIKMFEAWKAQQAAEDVR